MTLLIAAAFLATALFSLRVGIAIGRSERQARGQAIDLTRTRIPDPTRPTQRG